VSLVAGIDWEVIGPPDCPLMYRRTLVGNRWFKILWHRFVPNATDEALHDHPRSFVTVVLRGGYDDEHIVPGGIEVDRVRAPAVRYRRAEHSHITRVGSHGATTLVFMGPLRREWGFWRNGEWYQWRTFERLFGLNWRCPE
jgi:hypothetical protein